MKILVKKMSSFNIIKVQSIVQTVIMLVAMIALPIALLIYDASLLLNPYMLGTVIVAMLIFAGFAAFSIRPYFLYRKLPEVLVETDGEYLYIHGKKEAKIPLADLAGTSTFIHLPFMFSKEFIAILLTHLLSENYGDLDLDIPGYGSYKLRFVSNVQETSDELIAFINEALSKNV
jgi:hypothetical protein